METTICFLVIALFFHGQCMQSNSSVTNEPPELRFDACTNTEEILQQLDETDPLHFDTYTHAVMRYGDLIDNGYVKFNGEKIVQHLISKIEQSALEMVGISLDEIVEFFDFLFEDISPWILRNGFKIVVSKWKQNNDPSDIIDINDVFVAVMNIHFAKDERDLVKRLRALQCKSNFWVYTFAAGALNDLRGCNGVSIVIELLRYVSPSQWATLTATSLDSLMAHIKETMDPVVLWLHFKQICMKCEENGNNVSPEYIREVADYFIKHCRANERFEDADRIQQSLDEKNVVTIELLLNVSTLLTQVC